MTTQRKEVWVSRGNKLWEGNWGNIQRKLIVDKSYLVSSVLKTQLNAISVSNDKVYSPLPDIGKWE